MTEPADDVVVVDIAIRDGKVTPQGDRVDVRWVRGSHGTSPRMPARRSTSTYIFAHTLTYLVETGQAEVLALLSIDRDVSYVLSVHTSTLAALKVSFVVAGHVLAVVAAHDRALIVLPRAHRLSGQMGLLLLMVAYTFTGLFLLFSV